MSLCQLSNNVQCGPCATRFDSLKTAKSSYNEKEFVALAVCDDGTVVEAMCTYCPWPERENIVPYSTDTVHQIHFTYCGCTSGGAIRSMSHANIDWSRVKYVLARGGRSRWYQL